MATLVGFFTALWIAGAFFFLVGGLSFPAQRPWGWPWLVPVWPLCIAIGVADQQIERWKERRRLRRLMTEVWKR